MLLSRQCAAKAIQLIADDRTVANIRRYFPHDKAMLCLADFFECLTRCRKVLTSRVYKDNKLDEWRDALRVHFEVSSIIFKKMLKVSKFQKQFFSLLFDPNINEIIFDFCPIL